ncbi:hypothetical protein ANCDUO_02289, partial [Ancylostoma duodenale]
LLFVCKTCSEFSTFQRIKEYDENPKTRRYAANIIPIRENGNFMLCTIVLGNAFALPIGSYCRHLMVFFMVITYPASYPLSKLLDAVVIGVLNVKDLLLIDDSLDLHVGAVMQLWNRSTLFRFVTSESPVVQLMLELKKGFPLAIVVDYQHDKKCYHVTGIVTLEDNLEEVTTQVIGEIYDEKDVNLRGGTEFSGDMSVVPSRLDSLAPADLPHKKAKKRLAAQSKEVRLRSFLCSTLIHIFHFRYEPTLQQR